MANEIQIQLLYTVNNPSTGGGYTSTIRPSLNVTQSLLAVNAEVVSVPTAPTTYTFGNLTTYGYCFLQNLDATNYVSVGVQGQAISAPTQNAPSTSTSGGTLPAATYYYKVTALTLGGETTPSGEQSQTTTGSTSSNTVNWTAVTGATGYRIYRGTSSGGENVYYQVGTVTSFLDTNAASTAGSPPASNTTSFTPFAKLKPGEIALVRLFPGITFQLESNAAPCNVSYHVVND